MNKMEKWTHSFSMRQMFLNPGLAGGTGKKAYLIPDFLSSKVVQDEDSSIIHLGENANLSIVYGQRKPKLSDVTLSKCC